MALTLSLPFEQDGQQALTSYTLSTPRVFATRRAGDFNRVIYSGAHVVAEPLATRDPWLDSALDWEATNLRSPDALL